MKIHNIFLLFLLPFLSNNCSQQGNGELSNAVLGKKDISRIVLVGGTLISGMENYAFFERSMLQHYAGQEISFRNIGWPADDVFGLARSQFGSAQNTRSWEPPTAEEGFGSKVLTNHINEAAPSTLVVGYGSEVAFAKSEADFELFKSGYERLLDYVEEKEIKLILLSPPPHEKFLASETEWKKRNDWLQQASKFIQGIAQSRGHLYIDLFTHLRSNNSLLPYTQNGIQLNSAGYSKMNQILLKNLGLKLKNEFEIDLDENAAITGERNCTTQNWIKTVNGISFNLSPDHLIPHGIINSKSPIAVYVNGKLTSKGLDTINKIIIEKDSAAFQRLTATIKEKNRLHRYRLRPLNEAYIYLFRRHEMGHLAYEMDDLKKLVAEKEKEIQQLVTKNKAFIEIELIKKWKSPKDYPEDEVPAFIPEPNVEDELAAFHVADGYEVSLFAADPMIANPINVNWDTKGRAWVATSSIYPHIVPGREPNDKIIILEDTNADGVADKHTVFAENLLVPHSVMPVPGGAYVTATTELLFLADTDGDDIADEKRVIYDGFGNADIHHTIHGLQWMPWGDLHFTQSIYINTFVETPYGIRILNGSGIWSFRPESERLEIFSRGLINPWGETFDQWGQSFATDGAGSSGMNYIFPESAHATAVGAPKVLDGLNSGTPKNTAAEVIYSRHFPKEWQGTIITNDFRRNRTVRYQVTAQQSGYQSKEVQTVLRSDHRSYRPVDSKIGPDGALYIVDWYNPIIDHGEVDFHHPIRDRTHGRIWKLTKKGSPLSIPIDFSRQNPKDLLKYLKAKEQFTRLQANRAFVEQNGNPQLVVNWIKGLSKSESQTRIEGLWLLAALNYYEESLLVASLQSSVPQERAAAVRMLNHLNKQDAHLGLLKKLINDKHPQVRLETIHALRSKGDLKAAELATDALNHPMDVNLEFALDLTLRGLKEEWLPNLSRNESVFEGDQYRQLYALLTTEDHRVIGPINNLLDQANIDKELADRAWQTLAKIGDAATKEQVLNKALQDKESVLLSIMTKAPAAYNAVPEKQDALGALLSSEKAAIRNQALKLVGRWKATEFSQQVLAIAEKTEEMPEKLEALRSLVALGKIELVMDKAQNSTNVAERVAASSIWVEEEPKAAAGNAVELLGKLNSPALAEILFLTFRKLENGPSILEKALKGQKILPEIANVGLKVVQTSGLNLLSLDKAIREAGELKAVGMELSQSEKEQLITEAEQSTDIYRGKQIYRRKELLCASCHKIDGAGGLIGPNLSTVGAYMTPNSILESIINPSSDIKQNYETVLITKKNGELVSGILHRKTNKATLIRQANNEIIEIPSAEIAETDVSSVSLMPAGLTRNLAQDELKDLLAYLMSLGNEN